MFPNQNKARVLWIGLESGGSECREIFNAIESPLEKLGFPREARPFTPHVTLARIKNPRPVSPEMLIAPVSVPEFNADSAALFRSELKPGGAVYTPLAKFFFTMT